MSKVNVWVSESSVKFNWDEASIDDGGPFLDVPFFTSPIPFRSQSMSNLKPFNSPCNSRFGGGLHVTIANVSLKISMETLSGGDAGTENTFDI